MITSSIILIIFLLFFLILRNKLLCTLLFLPLIIYFFTYDIRNSVEVNDLLVFRKISSFSNYLINGISILISIIMVLLIDNGLSKKYIRNKVNFCNYNINRLKISFYILSLFSFLGTIINLSHVNFGFELLFLSPRDYELTFGSSTFINYLYFLSPVAICLLIFLEFLEIKIKFRVVFFILLFISSFFHGVKFTVFDTVLIPAFFYFYIKGGKVSLKLPAIIFSILFLFYWSFSVFIRGSEESDRSPIQHVISYVLPNYVNLAYSLSEKPFQWDGFSIFLPDKMPGVLDNYYILSNTGFVLNDAYNMETGYISYFRFAWYFGPIVFLLIIILIRRYILNICNFNLYNLFLVAIIDYCLLFVFFFHAFVKTKYWYFVIIVMIIHSYAKSSKKFRLNE